MISQSAMTYQANRAFALAELLDTTYKKAYQVVNEGTDDYESVLEEVKGLLFCAHEVAIGLATDLDSLIEKAELAAPAASKPAPSSDDLHSLGLKVWVAPRLRGNGITTVNQLTSLTALDLLKMPNVGKETLREIGLTLARNGLFLSAGGTA